MVLGHHDYFRCRPAVSCLGLLNAVLRTKPDLKTCKKLGEISSDTLFDSVFAVRFDQNERRLFLGVDVAGWRS